MFKSDALTSPKSNYGSILDISSDEQTSLLPHAADTALANHSSYSMSGSLRRIFTDCGVLSPLPRTPLESYKAWKSSFYASESTTRELEAALASAWEIGGVESDETRAALCDIVEFASDTPKHIALALSAAAAAGRWDSADCLLGRLLRQGKVACQENAALTWDLVENIAILRKSQFDAVNSSLRKEILMQTRYLLETGSTPAVTLRQLMLKAYIAEETLWAMKYHERQFRDLHDATEGYFAVTRHVQSTNVQKIWAYNQLAALYYDYLCLSLPPSCRNFHTSSYRAPYSPDSPISAAVAMKRMKDAMAQAVCLSHEEQGIHHSTILANASLVSSQFVELPEPKSFSKPARAHRRSTWKNPPIMYAYVARDQHSRLLALPLNFACS